MFPMLQHSRALLVTLRERADDDVCGWKPSVLSISPKKFTSGSGFGLDLRNPDISAEHISSQ